MERQKKNKSIKAKTAEHVQNQYLRTYVQKVTRKASRRKASVDFLANAATDGKPLTKKDIAREIARSSQDAIDKLPKSSSAKDRMEALLGDIDLEKSTLVSQSFWFRGIIALVVVANAVLLGVEVDYPEHRNTFYVLQHIFTAIFSLEAMLKIKEMHTSYFIDGWNLLDFVLVWLSILDVWILPLVMSSGDEPELRIFSMLRILRILRLLRALRLLEVFHELWKIVKGIINSLRAVSWTALLLIFLLYICGVFCCVMVGKNTDAGYLRFEDEVGHTDELGRDFDVYQYYGTVPRAMYTLFETCIEPLNTRPVIERQPWMAIFFFAFIFVSTFGVLNVIIGVIVQHTMSVSDENKNAERLKIFQEKMDMLELVRDYCFVDLDGDGKLSIQEIQKAFEKPFVTDTLEEVEMPLGLQPQELFDLLDYNGNGEVTHDDMLMQLSRATVQSDHQQLLDLKIGMHTTQRQINTITASLAELKSQVKYGFCQILPEEKMQSWPTKKSMSRSSSKEYSSLASNLNPCHLPETPVSCSLASDPSPWQLPQNLEACVSERTTSNTDKVEWNGESLSENEKRKNVEKNVNAKNSVDEKCLGTQDKVQKRRFLSNENLAQHDIPEVQKQANSSRDMVDIPEIPYELRKNADSQKPLVAAEEAQGVTMKEVDDLLKEFEPSQTGRLPCPPDPADPGSPHTSPLSSRVRATSSKDHSAQDADQPFVCSGSREPSPGLPDIEAPPVQPEVQPRDFRPVAGLKQGSKPTDVAPPD